MTRPTTRDCRAGGFGPPPRRRDESGQSAVELALALPIVFLLLLALLQTAVIVRDKVALTHAAREAAREAAVHDDRSAPRQAAVSRSGLDADRLTVRVSGQQRGSRRVSARLTYRVPTAVPIIGVLVPDLTLRAAAAMRREGL